MLRYEAMARAATFVDVSEYLITQTCSDCGAVGGPKGTKGLEIREWACGACGVSHDRDLNAAKIMLRLGRQVLAEGSSTLSAQRWGLEDVTSAC
jgi:transposase